MEQTNLSPAHKTQPDSNPSFIEMETVVCSKCGAERQQPGRAGRYGIEVCKSCNAILGNELFSKLCPPLFRKTDVSRLPAGQYEQAMQWKMGPTGLILRGQTGCGKTRIAWQLLKKLVDVDGVRGVMAFSCVSFSNELNKGYKEGNAEDWIESVWKAPLVFFDDLGKLKFTERVEAELFGVIDYRVSHELPIIATTNDTGDSLANRMSDDRGPALVRRLREFCEVISF